MNFNDDSKSKTKQIGGKKKKKGIADDVRIEKSSHPRASVREKILDLHWHILFRTGGTRKYSEFQPGVDTSYLSS